MKNQINVNNLVKAAMLTALSIIFSRILGIQLTPELKISFGTLPLMLCGIITGPILGALSGLACDMIGIMINIGGTFHPGFTISSILTGMLPGLIFYFGKKKDIDIKILIGLVIFFVYGVNHAFLTTLWLYQLYQTPFNILFISRLPKVVIDGFINYFLLYVIYKNIGSKIKM